MNFRVAARCAGEFLGVFLQTEEACVFVSIGGSTIGAAYG